MWECNRDRENEEMTVYESMCNQQYGSMRSIAVTDLNYMLESWVATKNNELINNHLHRN